MFFSEAVSPMFGIVVRRYRAVRVRFPNRPLRQCCREEDSMNKVLDAFLAGVACGAWVSYAIVRKAVASGRLVVVDKDDKPNAKEGCNE